MGLLGRLTGRDPRPAQADPGAPARRMAAALDRTEAPPAVRELVLQHAGWVLPYVGDQALPTRRDLYGPDQERRHDQLSAALRDADDPERRAAAAYVLASLTLSSTTRVRRHWWYSAEALLLTSLAKRRLDWTPAQTLWLVQYTANLPGQWREHLRELIRVPLAAAERTPASQRAALHASIRALIAQVDDHEATLWDTAERNRTLRRLRSLLPAQGDGERIPPQLLHGGDTYAPGARQLLIGRYGEPAAARVLVHLGGFGTGVSPSARWRAATRQLLTDEPSEDIDAAAVPVAVQVARTMLETLLGHRESAVSVYDGYAQETYQQLHFLHPDTVRLVRAAVWVLTEWRTQHPSQAWVLPLLGDLAVLCGVGLGGSGGVSRAAPVTNSAVAALAEQADNPQTAVDVVAQLARVRAAVENKTVRKGVDKALAAAAAAAGMTPGQLMERAVPTFGLAWDGTAERPVGEHTALLTLTSGPAGATLRVRWRTPAGRETTAAPAAVKTQHPDELAELRALAGDVKKAAAVQRARLEDLLAVDRTWTGADWDAHYVGHPVVGAHARALIWQARPAAAGDDAWTAGLPERDGTTWALRDPAGQLVPVGAGDEVRLWHPTREPLAEVRAWREHLTDRAFRQPFKQAFREIYLLTPAEEDTGTYSNRFAAHVLRYPQAGALMRARGWAGDHLGYWDGGLEGQAVKEIGEDGWRVLFFYELVEDDGDEDAIPALCATDQVRFERRTGPGPRAGWEPAPLAAVPPLVLSEAMRDVDLFVGVTSIANDPAWIDRGENRHRDYWTQASFGELTESAQARREALARLLPRTKIADRAWLTDRFLVVRGHLRTYKIHLGSGNILMSPADTYLCIVPSRKAEAPKQVFLPFEEDGGKLAVILSKAFLLADDAAITDPSITRQLRLGL